MLQAFLRSAVAVGGFYYHPRATTVDLSPVDDFEYGEDGPSKFRKLKRHVVPMNDILSAAERYALLGLAVIPIKFREKRPALSSWERYQHERPTDAEINAWFGNGRPCNLGIVCGSVSGNLVVVDFDNQSGYGKFALAHPEIIGRTRVHQTAQGYHVLLRTTCPVTTFKFANGDVKGEGGYVCAPPSVHPSGFTYTVVNDTNEIAVVEDLDVLGIKPVRYGRDSFAEKALRSELNEIARAPEGNRNNQLNRSAFALGQLVGAGALNRAEVETTLFDTAICVGLGEREARATIESGLNAGIREPRAIRREGLKYVPERNEDHHATNGEKQRAPTHDEIRDSWFAQYPGTTFGLGEWRRYENGVHARINADVVRVEISQEIEAFKPLGIRPASGILASVTELARVKIYVVDSLWNSDPDVIVCRNGMLHLPTGELLPHSPGAFATTGLAYDYDPTADCPAWNYCLNSTVPGATEFLQEFAGYSLQPSNWLETAVWFHGPRGSGKSTTVAGFALLHGERAGVLSLSGIERSSFALSNLPGKALVTATEQPATFIKCGHVLNAIISGELVQVEQKYKDSFAFKPTCKILWAMNELPRVSDASSGLFRRVKVVKFPQLSVAQDLTLKARIEQESSGLLNWAYEGWKRLSHRGHFEIPECVQNATDAWERTNDVPRLFVAECCVIGPEYKTQSQSLYDAYRTWCIENGHKPMSSTSTADEWERLGFTRVRSGGKTFWHGVGLVAEQV